MGIQWDESLTVGIELIDAQHKELFDRINRLLDACKRGEGKEEIADVVSFLGNYVVEHFESEEQAMQKRNYPAFSAHKQEHDVFRKDFETLKEDIAREGAGLGAVAKINKALVDWLIKHIGRSDKAFGAHCAAN
jgi:hemerythrin